MVRAKFKCESKERQEQGGFLVELFAVTDGSKENERFFKYTPGGELRLYTVNDEAAAAFEPGKSYYVDLTLAE